MNKSAKQRLTPNKKTIAAMMEARELHARFAFADGLFDDLERFSSGSTPPLENEEFPSLTDSPTMDH